MSLYAKLLGESCRFKIIYEILQITWIEIALFCQSRGQYSRSIKYHYLKSMAKAPSAKTGYVSLCAMLQISKANLNKYHISAAQV